MLANGWLAHKGCLGQGLDRVVTAVNDERGFQLLQAADHFRGILTAKSMIDDRSRKLHARQRAKGLIDGACHQSVAPLGRDRIRKVESNQAFIFDNRYSSAAQRRRHLPITHTPTAFPIDTRIGQQVWDGQQQSWCDTVPTGQSIRTATTVSGREAGPHLRVHPDKRCLVSAPERGCGSIKTRRRHRWHRGTVCSVACARWRHRSAFRVVIGGADRSGPPR